jgi:hypothetical protein
MALTKITARIDQVLWDSFSEQIDDLFIKKGAFLDFVIRTELPHLEQDLVGVKLSSKAKRFVANTLGARRPATVSIEVQKATSEALNEITKRHNIVRDAFINRLIIFLRGNDKLLRLIGAPESIAASDFFSLESLPTAPLRSMKCLYDDPLYYIRSFLHQSDQCGVYGTDLGIDHAWAACIINDDAVPGTRKHKQRTSISANDF